MISFADEVAASIPAQLTLPQEFRLTLEWMEAQGTSTPIAIAALMQEPRKSEP